MPAAARIGDSTSHGGVISTPCASTVYITRLKAARVSDYHICPMATGNVPHVGGPINMPGSSTVFIEYLQAARKGDAAICTGGPPDTIVTGAENVLVGG